MFTITLGLQKSNGQLALLDNGSSNDQGAQIDALDNYSAETYDELFVVDSVMGVVEHRELNAPDIKGKWLQIRAKNYKKVYGANMPTLEVDISGFMDKDTVSNLSGSLSIAGKNSGGSTVTLNASLVPGKYTLIPSGYTSSKYYINFFNGELEVSKKDIVVTAEDKTMEEGGSAPEYSFDDSVLVSGDSLSVSYTVKDSEGNTVADVTAAEPGEYSIVPTVANADTNTKYNITCAPGKLTITAASTEDDDPPAETPANSGEGE
jgi:hypothetical protein